MSFQPSEEEIPLTPVRDQEDTPPDVLGHETPVHRNTKTKRHHIAVAQHHTSSGSSEDELEETPSNSTNDSTSRGLSITSNSHETSQTTSDRDVSDGVDAVQHNKSHNKSQALSGGAHDDSNELNELNEMNESTDLLYRSQDPLPSLPESHHISPQNVADDPLDTSPTDKLSQTLSPGDDTIDPLVYSLDPNQHPIRNGVRDGVRDTVRDTVRSMTMDSEQSEHNQATKATVLVTWVPKHVSGSELTVIAMETVNVMHSDPISLYDNPLAFGHDHISGGSELHGVNSVNAVIILQSMHWTRVHQTRNGKIGVVPSNILSFEGNPIRQCWIKVRVQHSYLAKSKEQLTVETYEKIQIYGEVDAHGMILAKRKTFS